MHNNFSWILKFEHLSKFGVEKERCMEDSAGTLFL